MPSPTTPTIKISPPDSTPPSTPPPALETATPTPPPPPSRPPNHHSDSDISVLDLGPSIDTMHPSELHPAHTQLQLQLQTTLAPPTPLAVLPGTDALTLTTVPSTTTTVPSTTSTTKLTSEAHESDEDESGSTTPRPSTISFTSTSTTGTSGSGQSTPMPRRGRLVGGGVLASLRAFSSPLLMPLRGDVSSSPGSGGGSERGSGSGNGSGRRVRGAERPGVRRARTSLWGR